MPKGIGGSIAQMVRNPEGAGIKRLFFSQREIALIKDKTVAPGYGVLRAGTIVSVNASTLGNKGMLVPYVPVYGKVVAGADSATGVASLVQDGVSGNVKVSIADSYKFVVGDELYAESGNTASSLIALGAITAIDRTTDARWASITTAAYTATTVTVARACYVFVKSAAGSPWSTASFMIDKDVDTGVGADAVGALTSVVVSNAIVYTSSLVNATSEAITSLGAVQDGQHTILK